jgi:hypothetical protein
MFNHLKSFTVVVLLVITGCNKEKQSPPVRRDNISMYTLVAANGACSDAVATGTFQKGKQLTADAKITVTVDVKATGDWDIVSNDLIGISFAGYGTFTKTGLQTITLQGKGTPFGTGIVTFEIQGGTCGVQVTIIE